MRGFRLLPVAASAVCTCLFLAGPVVPGWIVSAAPPRSSEAGAEKGEKRESLVGKLPPELQVEKWFNSKPLTLAKDLRGRVVLLDFAFPSPKVVPGLMQFKSKLARQGFEIIGFMNRADPQIENFVTKMNLNYVVVRDDDGIEGGENGQYGKTWKAYGIPQSVDPRFPKDDYDGPTAFLIDRSGKVRWEGRSADLKEDALKALLTAK